MTDSIIRYEHIGEWNGYSSYMDADNEGEYVLYSNHVAAISVARDEGFQEGLDAMHEAEWGPA